MKTKTEHTSKGSRTRHPGVRGGLGLTSMRSWACSAVAAGVGCTDSTPIAEHARKLGQLGAKGKLESRCRRLRLKLLRFPCVRRRRRRRVALAAPQSKLACVGSSRLIGFICQLLPLLLFLGQHQQNGTQRFPLLDFVAWPYRHVSVKSFCPFLFFFICFFFSFFSNA